MFLGDDGNRKASFALIVVSESAKKLNCDQFVFFLYINARQKSDLNRGVLVTGPIGFLRSFMETYLVFQSKAFGLF